MQLVTVSLDSPMTSRLAGTEGGGPRVVDRGWWAEGGGPRVVGRGWWTEGGGPRVVLPVDRFSSGG